MFSNGMAIPPSARAGSPGSTSAEKRRTGPCMCSSSSRSAFLPDLYTRVTGNVRSFKAAVAGCCGARVGRVRSSTPVPVVAEVTGGDWRAQPSSRRSRASDMSAQSSPHRAVTRGPESFRLPMEGPLSEVLSRFSISALPDSRKDTTPRILPALKADKASPSDRPSLPRPCPEMPRPKLSVTDGPPGPPQHGGMMGSLLGSTSVVRAFDSYPRGAVSLRFLGNTGHLMDPGPDVSHTPSVYS